jgi:hypothetical protein
MIGSMSVHWWDAKVGDDDEKMIQTCQHGPVALSQMNATTLSSRDQDSRSWPAALAMLYCMNLLRSALG